MAGSVYLLEEGLPEAMKTIGRLGEEDRDELLDGLGALVESQTRRRIAEEKRAPDGSPWPAWSADYAATRHNGHSLLQGENDLLDSLQLLRPAGDRVAVGSNLIYAAIHQFGGAEAGRPIPERPYLGLSDANAEELRDETRIWLAELVQ